MKKVLCYSIAVLMLLSLAACTLTESPLKDATDAPDATPVTGVTAEPYPTQDPAKEANDPGTEFNNRFGQGYSNLAETEDAYYYSGFNSKYLYYYDKASGEYAVLCGKPECMHDAGGQNRDCSGYIDKLGRSLNLCDGRLYYAASDHSSNSIGYYSIALDGTDRRLETHLGQGPSLMCYDLHRGMLYGWRDYEKVVDGAPKNAFDILRFDPKSGAMQLLLTFETSEACSQPSLFFLRDHVYFCFSTEAYNDAETDGSQSAVDTLYVGRINTVTLEAEQLLEETKEGGFGSSFRLWVENEDRIFLVPMLSAAYEETINVYLLSGGELSIAHTFSSTGSAYPIEGAAVNIYPAGNHAEIWGFDGTEIYNGEWQTDFEDEDGVKYRATALDTPYGDLDTLCVVYSVKAEGDSAPRGVTTCLVRYDLTGDVPKPELLIIAPSA